MKSYLVTPFLILPLLGYGTELKAQPKSNTHHSSAQNPQKKDPEDSLDLFEKLFNFKVEPLTITEKRALDGIEDFLKKYTDGTLDYSIQGNLVRGITQDYSAINQKGLEMGGVKGRAAERYPKNLLPRTRNKIHNEAEKRAHELTSKIFIGLGVDPSTANKKVQIKNLPRAKDIKDLSDNLIILGIRSNKVIKQIYETFGDGEDSDGYKRIKLVFKEGFSLQTIQDIRDRVFPPEGAEFKESKKPSHKIPLNKTSYYDNTGQHYQMSRYRLAHLARKQPLKHSNYAA